MGKWEVPTQEEMEIIRKLGMNPKHCAVAHPGDDQLIILDWQDHRIDKREHYVLLTKKTKNHK